MEEQQFFVTLDRVAEESGLTAAYTPKDLKEIKIYATEVYRPGIFLAGYAIDWGGADAMLGMCLVFGVIGVLFMLAAGRSKT